MQLANRYSQSALMLIELTFLVSDFLYRKFRTMMHLLLVKAAFVYCNIFFQFNLFFPFFVFEIVHF